MPQVRRYCRGQKTNKQKCTLPVPEGKEIPYCHFHEWQDPGHQDFPDSKILSYSSRGVKTEDRGLSQYINGMIIAEDTMFLLWYHPTGRGAGTPAEQLDATAAPGLGPTNPRLASQLNKPANDTGAAKEHRSFLKMIDSRSQHPTSFDDHPNPRKTRNKATFEDEHLQENELDTSDGEFHSTTERMRGASLNDRRHQRTPSKNTTSEARESRSKPQPPRGERSLNKVFDDCLRTVYSCAYSQACEDLLPGGSRGNKRTQLEAKMRFMNTMVEQAHCLFQFQDQYMTASSG